MKGYGMRTLSKWNIFVCFGLIMMMGGLGHAGSCAKKVKEYCQFNTCDEYCQFSGIDKADCNCRQLCTAQDDNELTRLNAEQEKQCEASKDDDNEARKKAWKGFRTDEWLDRTQTARGNPFQNVCLGEMTVKEATTFCESVVIQHCKQVTAPKFCEIKGIERDSCDVDSLCVLDLDSARLAAKKANKANEQSPADDENMSEEERAADGRARDEESRLLKKNTDNAALDAQNAAQLMACVAEKRDPYNQKTGRQTFKCDERDELISWCWIVSPSWRRTVETPADKAERKQSICSGNSTAACRSAEKGMAIPEGIKRSRGGDECAVPGREEAARAAFDQQSGASSSRADES